MTVNPFLLLGLGAAGLAFASSKGKPVSQTITTKPGETWRITVRAVGDKIQPSMEGQLRAAYPGVKSYSLNDAGDTIIVELTFTQPGHITTNQLISLTTSPDKGVMITEAVLEPASLPAFSVTATDAKRDMIALNQTDPATYAALLDADKTGNVAAARAIAAKIQKQYPALSAFILQKLVPEEQA